MYSALPPAGLKFSTPLQLSPTRKTTLTSQSSVSPVSPKSAPPNFSWGYHLDTVSALQGSNEYDHRTRAQIASATKDLDDVAKTALIDFLASEDGAIASTLGNNACKHFNCSTEELEYVLDEENVDSLVELWHRTYTLILPTIYGMLYPLEGPQAKLKKNWSEQPLLTPGVDLGASIIAVMYCQKFLFS
ncbi:hypothetical protein AAVH_28441 [Aphelenchoides avenae]|nr:hypothetical protein AAVH_28441 [Aphelenchus avenae]